MGEKGRHRNETDALGVHVDPQLQSASSGATGSAPRLAANGSGTAPIPPPAEMLPGEKGRGEPALPHDLPSA